MKKEKPQYDPVTLRQLRIIAIEKRITDLEKFTEIAHDDMADHIEDIEADVVELQKARKVQIGLNTGYTKDIQKLSPQPRKWFWQ